MKNYGSCGINCESCNHKIDKECKGCKEMKGNPFWGECDWYVCSHEKGFEHCCCCSDFACDRLVEAVCGEGATDAINNLKELHKSHTN